MSLVLIAEQILNGLQFGIMLFLMSAGLTLIFGVMGLINLAHGSLYMIGAFMAAAVASATGSFILALFAALSVAALAGTIVEMTIIRKLYNRDHLDQVLATFALILIFSEGTRWVFGSFPLYLDVPAYLQGAVTLPGGIQYPLYRITLIVFGLIIGAGLGLLITKTRIGVQIRAGENDREMVSALGVNISKLYTFVFALGAALAGLAGALVGAIQSVEVGMGEPVLILAFVVIVIGGIRFCKRSSYWQYSGWSYRYPWRNIFTQVIWPFYGLSNSNKCRLINCVNVYLHSYEYRSSMAAYGSIRTKNMIKERHLNTFVLGLLILIPIWAYLNDEPFIITLMTRAVIFAIAAVGLNLALGIGGFISFGHAAFLWFGGLCYGHTSLALPKLCDFN